MPKTSAVNIDAQRARGFELDAFVVDVVARVRRLAPLAVPVTMTAIMSGEDITDALDMRGFGLRPRTWLHERRMPSDRLDSCWFRTDPVRRGDRLAHRRWRSAVGTALSVLTNAYHAFQRRKEGRLSRSIAALVVSLKPSTQNRYPLPGVCFGCLAARTGEDFVQALELVVA